MDLISQHKYSIQLSFNLSLQFTFPTLKYLLLTSPLLGHAGHLQVHQQVAAGAVDQAAATLKLCDQYILVLTILPALWRSLDSLENSAENFPSHFHFLYHR